MFGATFSSRTLRLVAAVPDLAASRELARVEMGSDRYYLLLMHLRRGLNRVVWQLKQARKFAGVVEVAEPLRAQSCRIWYRPGSGLVPMWRQAQG